RLATALGEPEKGAMFVRRFDDALPNVPDTLPAHAPRAALYWANGLTSGDDTLAGAIVRAAGFRNLAGELGIDGDGQIALEQLIRANPDVVITGEGRETDSPSLATELLRHPALAKAFADKLESDISSTAWVCGTPLLADAVRRLQAFRVLHFAAAGDVREGRE